MHLVVFDIDGTLTETNRVDEICFVQAIAEILSISEINTDWLTYRHVTDSGILQEVFESRYARLPDRSEVNNVQQRFYQLLEQALGDQPSLCEAVQGAVEALQQLADEADQAVALATGGWEPSARAKLRRAGYRTEEVVLASASDAYAREDIMMLAEQRARAEYDVVEFDSVTYVGDGVWDFQAAAELGWRFIGIAAGEQASALRQVGATTVVSRYSGSDFVNLVRCVQEA